MIVDGVRTFDVRSGVTRYRGPLLIFASTFDMYEAHRLQLPEGDTGVVIGGAYLIAINAVTKKEWTELQRQHKISGGRPYGDETFMWIFKDPQRFIPPVLFDETLMIDILLIVS